MRFHISADCLSRQGRPTRWAGKVVEAKDQLDAIDQADRLLSRAGHDRYKITATPVAEEKTDG